MKVEYWHSYSRKMEMAKATNQEGSWEVVGFL
jgi:hypothetical protein